MIEQELYIEILELFDLLKEEECFKEYIVVQDYLENNKDIVQIIYEYNFILNTIENIDYQPFIEQQTKELEVLENKINSNEEYQKYLSLHKVCNDRLVEISKLIFDDVVEINQGGCHCANK
ncbi:MAG: YlbF family regulator [Erysipelotrichales bacterium]